MANIDRVCSQEQPRPFHLEGIPLLLPNEWVPRDCASLETVKTMDEYHIVRMARGMPSKVDCLIDRSMGIKDYASHQGLVEINTIAGLSGGSRGQRVPGK